MRRTPYAAVLVLVGIVLGLGVVACGGDGDGGGGDFQVDVDPKSGPPGTTITWTISGCPADWEKAVSLQKGTSDELLGSATQGLVDETMLGPSSIGTLHVPDKAAPGQYTVSAHCRFESQPDAQGNTAVSTKPSAFTEFEVTE